MTETASLQIFSRKSPGRGRQHFKSIITPGLRILNYKAGQRS